MAEIEGLLQEIEEPRPVVADRREHRSPSRRERERPARATRKISIRLAALLVVLSIVGTAFALTQTTLPTQFLELWQSQTQATDFTLTQFVLTPVGDNQINIDLTLQNDDVSVHFANVTVQLLDVNGDHILNQTKPSGAVAGGGSAAMSYVFSQVGLVALYEKSQINVNQTS